jgi:phosphohistidine phosphatase
LQIYLLRHGIATGSVPGSPDSARELTTEGRQKVAAVVRTAHHAGVAPSLIVSSPYKRALQTARIAAHEFDYEGEIVEMAALEPFGTPQGVWNELRDHRDQASLLVAGHEPLLSSLAAYLLSTPELRIEMKKATLLRIDLEVRPPGTLRWMLTAGLAT